MNSFLLWNILYSVYVRVPEFPKETGLLAYADNLTMANQMKAKVEVELYDNKAFGVTSEWHCEIILFVELGEFIFC